MKKISANNPRQLAGKTIGVVGLGQIGGSLVKRLSAYRQHVSLIGTDTKRRLATQVGRYCRFAPALEDVVLKCDLLILAVPVPAILELLPTIAGLARQRTQESRFLVADTGTVKRPVMKAAGRYRSRFDFVGMHPLAGSHIQGWAGSRAGLFAGVPFFYCTTSRGWQARWVRELIGLLDATPVPIQADRHDKAIGVTISLPHMLAYAAEGLADDLSVPAPLKGRSWNSLTRVAASDPAMVAGFLHANRNEVTQSARQFLSRLDRLIRALDDPTGRRVLALLQRWRRSAE